MKNIICIYFLVFISCFSYSQDIKKVIKRIGDSPIVEEYFVLKSDKSIKNGNYVKYSERLVIEKYFQEFGSFDNNKKSGVWFYFNSIHPQNPLSIVGEYKDDQKTGQWAYFYLSEVRDTNVLNLLGINKTTNIISRKKDLQITLDTTGLKLAAIGNFDKNEKTGEWNYYSREGRLIKTYDFSQKKQISGFRTDSINLDLLGGFWQFQAQLSQTLFENSSNLPDLPSAEASLEIITNDGNVYVNNLNPLSDNQLALYIENAIKNMPQFWIDYDPIFEKFSFIINLKYNHKESGSSFNIQSISPKFNKNN